MKSKKALRKEYGYKRLEDSDQCLERPMSKKLVKHLLDISAELHDPHTYVIVSNTLGKMKLYYQADSNTYVMNRPFLATRFHSLEVARAVQKSLDSKTLSKDGWTLIKSTKKNNPKSDRLQVWKVKQSATKKTWKFVAIV